MYFNFWWCNVKSNPLMPNSHVEADMKDLRDLGLNGAMCEIQPEYYKTAVEEVFKGLQIGNLGCETPTVFSPGKFKVESSFFIWAHEGKAEVTPTRITSVTLAHTNDGAPVAGVFEHRISGAWSHKDPVEWRQEKWWQHQATTKGIVKGLNIGGRLIIGAGDYNKGKIDAYSANQKAIHDLGIDKMWFVPSRTHTLDIERKQIITDKVEHMYTDHPILWMNAQVVKR